MILELDQDEMMVFNSLIDSGLSDFAVLAQLFDIYGITTRVLKTVKLLTLSKEALLHEC
jgi:hypothetical protein